MRNSINAIPSNHLRAAQLRCVVCNTENDLNCVYHPGSLESSPCPAATADGLNAICITRVVNGTQIIRDCGLGQTCDINDATCNLCTNTNGQFGQIGLPEHVCNRNVLLPAARSSCVQCNGDLNSTCSVQQFGQHSIPCAGTDTRCFTRRSERLIMRGCESQHRGLCDDSQQCLFCNHVGCNNLAANNTLIPMASSADSLASAAHMLVLGALAMLLKV